MVQVHVGATKHVSIDSASLGSVATLFKRQQTAQDAADLTATKVLLPRNSAELDVSSTKTCDKRAREGERGAAPFSRPPAQMRAVQLDPAASIEPTGGERPGNTATDTHSDEGPGEVAQADDGVRASTVRRLEMSAAVTSSDARNVDMLQVLGAFDEGELGLDELDVLTAAMHKSAARV